MSDDTPEDSYWANAGITLPGESNAVYDVGLSPLFSKGAGYVNLAANQHGGGQNLWSNVVYSQERISHYGHNSFTSRPSQYDWANYGFSLRCLVSTANS